VPTESVNLGEKALDRHIRFHGCGVMCSSNPLVGAPVNDLLEKLQLAHVQCTTCLYRSDQSSGDLRVEHRPPRSDRSDRTGQSSTVRNAVLEEVRQTR
jgi:hypothetical protein